MAKYLTESEIDAIIGRVEVVPGFQLMSQDTYNEQLLAKRIAATGKSNELLSCAINLAVVGFGNKKYGVYRQNETIINIGDVLKSVGAKLNNQSGAQLKEDDITPQRLCRFFRHKIKSYILQNNIQSYLFKKYTDRTDKYRGIVFRGSEYLDDLTEDEFKYLLDAVTQLDSRLSTNIANRVLRVYEAKKGIQYRKISPIK